MIALSFFLFFFFCGGQPLEKSKCRDLSRDRNTSVKKKQQQENQCSTLKSTAQSIGVLILVPLSIFDLEVILL